MGRDGWKYKTDLGPAKSDISEIPKKIVAKRGEDRVFLTGIRNTLGRSGLLYPARSLALTRILGQILGLSLALLLFGGGMWANVSGGSLSQNKGAWVSHASR